MIDHLDDDLGQAHYRIRVLEQEVRKLKAAAEAGLGPALRREPAPIPNGASAPNVTDLVIQDLRDRDGPGIQKYGTALQPRNGRNTLVDGYQEFLDGAKYFRLALEDFEEAFDVFALLRREMGRSPAEKGAVLRFAQELVNRARGKAVAS